MSATRLVFTHIQGAFAEAPLYQAVETNNYFFSAMTFDTRVDLTEASIHCFRFNNSGTKVYLNDGTTIYQYSLAIPFSLASMAASPDGSYNWDSAATQLPHGFEFSSDGSTIIGMGRTFGRMSRWTLGTPFDITGTVTYVGSTTFTSTDCAIAMKPDGTDFVYLSSDTDILRQRTMLTPYSPVTSTSQLFTYDVSAIANPSSYSSLTYGDRGKHLYVPDTTGVGASTDSFVNLRLNTAYELKDVDVLEEFPLSDYIGTYDPVATGEVPYCVNFNEDGSKIYTLTRDGADSYLREWNAAQFPIADSYKQSELVYNTLLTPDSFSGAIDIQITPDYFISSNGGAFQVCPITVSGDVTTVDFTAYDIQSWSDSKSAGWFCIDPSGTTVIGLDGTTGEFNEFSITSPFSPGSGISTVTTSTLIIGDTLRGIDYVSNGDYLIVGNVTQGKIHVFSLPTAYSLAGATEVAQFDLGVISLGIFSNIKIFEDRYLFVKDTEDVVHKYRLGTVGDITTAIYSGKQFDLPYEYAKAGQTISQDLFGFYWANPTDFVSMEGLRGRVWSVPESVDTDWTPLDLFSSGEQGVWYDMSDTTSLFQDAAQTIPVTTMGDPVKGVVDKSGNGHDLSISGTGTAPTWETGSAVYFPGGTDYLEASATTALGFMHDASSFSTACGVTVGTSANPDTLHYIFGTIPTIGTASTGYCMFYDDRSSVPRSNMLATFLGASVPGSAVISDTNGDEISPLSNTSIVCIIDPDNATASDRIRNYVDGDFIGSNNTSTETPASSSSVTFRIGSDDSASWPYEGYVYQVICVDRALTYEEIYKLDAYIKSRMI